MESNRSYQNNPWAPAKSFEKDGVCVRVERKEVAGKTHFRAKVGRLDTNNNFVFYIPFMMSGLGKVSITRVNEVVQSLLKTAEDWAHNEAQYAEDRFIETKTVQETKQVNQGKQTTRHTGKTQRNRDKRKGVVAA